MTKIVCPILEKLYDHIRRLISSFPNCLSAQVAEELLKTQCKHLVESLSKQSSLKPDEERT